eukprot:1136864-Pelagomonas_calceolata.AAC.8
MVASSLHQVKRVILGLAYTPTHPYHASDMLHPRLIKPAGDFGPGSHSNISIPRPKFKLGGLAIGNGWTGELENLFMGAWNVAGMKYAIDFSLCRIEGGSWVSGSA